MVLAIIGAAEGGSVGHSKQATVLVSRSYTAIVPAEISNAQIRQRPAYRSRIILGGNAASPLTLDTLGPLDRKRRRSYSGVARIGGHVPVSGVVSRS